MKTPYDVIIKPVISKEAWTMRQIRNIPSRLQLTLTDSG